MSNTDKAVKHHAEYWFVHHSIGAPIFFGAGIGIHHHIQTQYMLKWKVYSQTRIWGK